MGKSTLPNPSVIPTAGGVPVDQPIVDPRQVISDVCRWTGDYELKLRCASTLLAYEPQDQFQGARGTVTFSKDMSTQQVKALIHANVAALLDQQFEGLLQGGQSGVSLRDGVIEIGLQIGASK